MKRIFYLPALILLAMNCSVPNEQTDNGLNLVWSDEFEQDGLPDPEKWDYDYGNTCDRPFGCGWGNNEKQFYTRNDPDNARVENGVLIIEARKEQMDSSAYTSARLVTRGKHAQRYGRVEVRAKLPSGRGTWPAIWMLPRENQYGGWPRSGEIDIMEHVGYEPDSVFGTVHTEAYNHSIGTQRGGQIYLPDAETAFHTYAIDWTTDQIDFWVDDQKYFTFQNEKSGSEAWPFDQAFYLILNIAVGGNWGGAQGIDDSIWPQRMEIDYVRFYQ